MSNPIITIVGRVGSDPEAVGSNGIRFRVATNDRVKNDNTGQWEDRNTSWWTVKAWRTLADQSKSVIKKGMEVIIVGKIYEDTWTDKEGVKKSSYEINADSISVTAYTLSKNKLPSNADFPSDKTKVGVPF